MVNLAVQSISASNAPLSARVAQAGADYFENATSTAANETAVARRALSRATESSDEAKDRLSEAKKSLVSATEAYRKAESTVFFVDPESVEELRAQPDPLHVGSGSSGKSGDELAALGRSLEKTEKLLSGPADAAKAAALLEEAKIIAAKIDAVESGFRDLADAWKGDSGDNFRGKFFLSSSQGAVARMFQGLLAISGDLLPGKLDSEPADPAEISSRLRAVREIYLGSPDDVTARATPHQLVQEASPVQAALTRASVARALALAEVLEISPDAVALRKQLATALDDLTRQLTFAAGSLGIEISVVEP